MVARCLLIFLIYYSIGCVLAQNRIRADICNRLPLIPNGDLDAVSLDAGLSTWRIVCRPPFFLNGSDLVTCTNATGWSTNAQCVDLKKCALPNVTNAIVLTRISVNGSPLIASVECIEGYSLRGHYRIVCDRYSGQFSEPGKCLPKGGQPSNCELRDWQIANGFAYVDDGGNVAVQCYKDFSLGGSNRVICNKATDWQWKWDGTCVPSSEDTTTQTKPPPTPAPTRKTGLFSHQFKTNRVPATTKKLQTPVTTNFIRSSEKSAKSEIPALTNPNTAPLLRTQPTVIGVMGSYRTVTLPKSSNSVNSNKERSSSGSTYTVSRYTVIQLTSTQPAKKRICGNSTSLVQSASLINAIRSGDNEIFHSALYSNADPNSRDTKNLWSALIWAANNRQTRFMAELINCGADVNARSSSDSTPLTVAVNSGGSIEAIRLLLENGADPDLGSKNNVTALQIAASRCRIEVVRVLLSYDVNLSAQDRDGNTALISAVKASCIMATGILLNAGADANQKNYLQQTPLMIAARNGNNAIVTMLLLKGARTAPTDSDGNSAISLATENRHDDTVDLLMIVN